MSQNGTRVRDKLYPPKPGISLGWRLALYTSLVVSLVMGMATISQEYLDTKHDLQKIRAKLRDSIVPLAKAISQASDFEEVESQFMIFHDAYVSESSKLHHLTLKNEDDAIILTTGPLSTFDPGEFIDASISLTNRTLSDDRLLLTVFVSRSDYVENFIARWRRWAFHFGVTLVSILIVLQYAIHLLVTLPLKRLLDAIRKMEMGYWGDVEYVGGAWEIQWLNWRFHNMGRELQRTVRRLLEAERRASSVEPALASAASQSESDGFPDPPASLTQKDSSLLNHLVRQCLELEAVTHRNHHARALARIATDRHAFDAERIGEMELKYRLENAAFRVLEPSEYRRIKSQLAELQRDKKKWLNQCREDFGRALEQKMIPIQVLQCRCKHAAGVWKKMQAKGLSIEQIHDLFAIRVVVPTESDCYWALGVAHEIFTPIVGRFKDYIAYPKDNGYKSIHTCVETSDGQVVEIQIRSVAMHRHAEHGAASHLKYKMNHGANLP